MPFNIGEKKSPLISGRSRPIVFVRLLASTRAAWRGTNCSSSIASRTRSALSAWTGVVPFRTRLTVAIETSAWRATSAIVGGRLFGIILGVVESVFRKRFQKYTENKYKSQQRNLKTCLISCLSGIILVGQSRAACAKLTYSEYD